MIEMGCPTRWAGHKAQEQWLKCSVGFQRSPKIGGSNPLFG